jgi:hypothetical protein
MPKPPVPTDPAKLRDAALDVFVYAPIGFLFDAKDVVPKLAERGKGQVALARLFGRYALQRGQIEADRLINARRAESPRPATDVDETSSSTASEGVPAPDAGRAAAADVTTTVTTATTSKPAKSSGATAKAAKASKSTPRAARGSATALAIPGYDTLSASQVVPRLDALRPDELESVRAYEASHRGRRTILNRIAQLQA